MTIDKIVGAYLFLLQVSPTHEFRASNQPIYAELRRSIADALKMKEEWVQEMCEEKVRQESRENHILKGLLDSAAGRVSTREEYLKKHSETICKHEVCAIGYDGHLCGKCGQFFNPTKTSSDDPLNGLNIICTELYDDYIRYKRAIIYRGNVKKLSPKEIDKIRDDYDKSQLPGEHDCYYYTDFTGKCMKCGRTTKTSV